MEELLKEIKEWIEEDTGPGFSYHIGHCDDLSGYYEQFRDKLENLGWRDVEIPDPENPEKTIKALIHP